MQSASTTMCSMVGSIALPGTERPVQLTAQCREPNAGSQQRVWHAGRLLCPETIAGAPAPVPARLSPAANMQHGGQAHPAWMPWQLCLRWQASGPGELLAWAPGVAAAVAAAAGPARSETGAGAGSRSAAHCSGAAGSGRQVSLQRSTGASSCAKWGCPAALTRGPALECMSLCKMRPWSIKWAGMQGA